MLNWLKKKPLVEIGQVYRKYPSKYWELPSLEDFTEIKVTNLSLDKKKFRYVVTCKDRIQYARTEEHERLVSKLNKDWELVE